MMNTNRTLPQVLIFGAALMASALASSVYAADATISFTGEIIPAANSAKAATGSKENVLSTDKKSTPESGIKQGEDHATR